MDCSHCKYYKQGTSYWEYTWNKCDYSGDEYFYHKKCPYLNDDYTPLEEEVKDVTSD